MVTYTMFPNGQLWGKAYAVAENGTQKIMNSRSATARFMISRLVVFRICLLKVTTNTTRRFPTKPTKTMIEKNIGTTIDTTFSIFLNQAISGGTSASGMFVVLSILPLINESTMLDGNSSALNEYSVVTFIVAVVSIRQLLNLICDSGDIYTLEVSPIF